MTPRRTLILLPLLALVAALAGCGGSGADKVSPGDVAVVGSQHITQAQFVAALAEAKASLKAQGQTLPAAGSTGYAQLKTNVVGLLVQQAELGLEAKKLGVTASDAAVNKKLAAIKKQFFGGNDKRYVAGLKKQGFTDAQFRAYIKENILESNLYKAITKDATTTQEAVDAYYAANLTQYKQAASRAVEEILVGKNKEALANKIYAQLKAGADFAALAKKFSQDPGSKNIGGKFTANQGSDVPEFDQAVFAATAKTGELLKPVNTKQYGWFVIKPLADITPAKTTPESTATAEIRKKLKADKAQQIASDWMGKVVKSYCSGGKIAYGSGYVPSPDPCATLSSPDHTTT
jgi:parvulin-like peptidyl-prolyl isomerase